jgi:hypothetical protein
LSCEHLICAHCAAPVIEGRCPACQSARAQFHHHRTGLAAPLTLAAAFIGLLLLLLAFQLAGLH